MKKSLILALVAVGVVTLAGCQSAGNAGKKVDTAPVDNVYTGVIPCGDCSGIEATLLVNPDGSYVEQLIYLGTKDGNSSFHDSGKWALSEGKLRTTNEKGDNTYFMQAEDGKSVTLLDLEGNPIDTKLNYTLEKVTPSKKRGEYRYMADAAVFKECETGRIYSAPGVDLEKAYGETGVAGGTPVYVEVEGYYSVRPSMEDGQFDPALVQTGEIKFDSKVSCK